MSLVPAVRDRDREREREREYAKRGLEMEEQSVHSSTSDINSEEAAKTEREFGHWELYHLIYY